MKPVIGIIPLYDEFKDSVWMVPGYMNGIEEAGGLPIILPYTIDTEEILQAARMCDGFLFTGGHDVSPSVYGEEAKETCGVACEVRDTLEKIVFDFALSEDKPVFGICRGIQMINALCGGTLYQDLPTEYESSVEHHMEPPYDRGVHDVIITKTSPFYKLFNADKISVNSYHHQAVKKLGEGLEIFAKSEDGLVEGIFMPDKKYIVALQWHPEFSYKVDENSRLLFEEFINHCR